MSYKMNKEKPWNEITSSILDKDGKVIYEEGSQYDKDVTNIKNNAVGLYNQAQTINPNAIFKTPNQRKKEDDLINKTKNQLTKK